MAHPTIGVEENAEKPADPFEKGSESPGLPDGIEKTLGLAFRSDRSSPNGPRRNLASDSLKKTRCIFEIGERCNTFSLHKQIHSCFD